MVKTEGAKASKYSKGIQYAEDNTDLSLFLSYIETIKELKGITTHKLLKDAGIHTEMVTNIKYLLKGKKIYKPTLSIRLLLKLYSVYNVPFNLSDYIHLIDKKD
jgi:hypothetical protein